MKYSLLAGLISALILSFLIALFQKPSKYTASIPVDCLLAISMCCSDFGAVPDDKQLHFLELCAGSHRLTDVAGEYGLSALAMDAPHL